MPIKIYNDGLDDEAASDQAEDFTGMNMAVKPSRLPAGTVRNGKNMWADVDRILRTRPAAKFVSLLNDTPGAGTYRIQGSAYYDTPSIERILAVRQGKLYEIPSADDNTAGTVLAGPAYSTTADVRLAQLVTYMFGCDGTLRFHTYSAGWTHGTVTTFADASAMPAWALIVAHGFRLLAVEIGGHKLYTSAIGQANTNTDWTKTDTFRVGTGEGDPIKALISGQGGNLIVLNERSAWAVNTRDAAVANWTSDKITGLTGCVEGKTAVSFGQDVLFLSRYGVVSLGALQATDSINPAATLSAPIQAVIDRINWAAIGTAFATAWRSLYVLALPLDSNTYPNHFICFHTITGQWSTLWEAPLANVDVSAGPTVTATFAGYSAGLNTRFAAKQETVLGDTCGRLLRLDDLAEKDQSSAATDAEIESWATLRALDYGVPAHLKQPFWTEIEFFRSSAQGVQINLVRDGLLTYPDKALVDCDVIAAGLTTGNLTTFPLVFPLVFQSNEAYRKSYHIRNLPRFREAGLQIVAASGTLCLRQALLTAFVDTPNLTQ